MSSDQASAKYHWFFGWIFAFYFFIFQPPIIPKLAYLAVQFFIFVVVFLLYFRRYKNLVFLFRVEFALVFVLVCYSLARDVLVGEIVYSDRFLGWYFQAFLFSGILVIFYPFRRDKRLSSVYFPVEMYAAILIAGVLSCALFLFPVFDSFYESIQLDGYYERYSGFEVRYRAFGISENLTFTYAVVLGVGAGYSLVLANRSWVYLFFIPIFVFGVLINARVGFLGVVFFLLYSLFFGRLILKLFLVFLFIVSMIWLLLFSGDFVSENAWRLGFFLEFMDFFVHGFSGDNIIATLVNDHFIFPVSVLDTIFGSGVSIYVDADQTSDVGYVLQLNYGGLVLILLLFLIVFFMGLRLFKVLGCQHWYPWLFFVSIFLLNFKGFIFAMTPGGRFLICLYVFFIYRESMHRKARCKS